MMLIKYHCWCFVWWPLKTIISSCSCHSVMIIYTRLTLSIINSHICPIVVVLNDITTLSYFIVIINQFSFYHLYTSLCNHDPHCWVESIPSVARWSSLRQGPAYSCLGVVRFIKQGYEQIPILVIMCFKTYGNTTRLIDLIKQDFCSTYSARFVMWWEMHGVNEWQMLWIYI